MSVRKKNKNPAETMVKEEREASKAKLIPVHVMGKRYEVPEGLTLMKAMEYAGYKFIRGCGCRGGTCGACGTVYRRPGDYRLQVALACQKTIEPDMHIAQIPFFPANRARYEFADLTSAPEEVFRLYPELFRCVACNACTKACPQGIEVMDAVSALKQGNITEAAQLGFECIQCGLCTSRCFGELVQYHMFQLARRICGARIIPRAEHLAEMIKVIAEGRYEDILGKLKHMSEEELIKLYQKREGEPVIAGEDWRPKDKTYL
ncbi:MAG: 4Fe-4S dicluster domain-containing protein [Dehalococcoidia bacterium]|nr:MAG: 4Fe-4S dicluster domain-containing protein [Dehalococcoidia bacterium]